MPCEKMLAWLCPVASAIRLRRLISQSALHGGNADRLNKQQVLGSRGRGRVEGRGEAGLTSKQRAAGPGAGEGHMGALQRELNLLTSST